MGGGGVAKVNRTSITLGNRQLCFCLRISKEKLQIFFDFLTNLNQLWVKFLEPDSFIGLSVLDKICLAVFDLNKWKMFSLLIERVKGKFIFGCDWKALLKFSIFSVSVYPGEKEYIILEYQTSTSNQLFPGETGLCILFRHDFGVWSHVLWFLWIFQWKPE